MIEGAPNLLFSSFDGIRYVEECQQVAENFEFPALAIEDSWDELDIRVIQELIATYPNCHFIFITTAPDLGQITPLLTLSTLDEVEKFELADSSSLQRRNKPVTFEVLTPTEAIRAPQRLAY